MKRIAIKAYNNDEYLTDTDFIILNLSENKIDEIKHLQSKLQKHFFTYSAQVKLYNIDFKVHTYNAELNKEIVEWMEPNNVLKETEYIFLKDSQFDYESLATSEDENDVRLDTYILIVTKDTIWCKCYAKYNGNIEVYSSEVNINEL